MNVSMIAMEVQMERTASNPRVMTARETIEICLPPGL